MAENVCVHVCVCELQSKRKRENIQSYRTNANGVGFHLSLQHPLWKAFAFPQSQFLPTCPLSKSRAVEQFYVTCGSPDLERVELKIFEKQSSYFKVATMDMAEDWLRTAVCLTIDCKAGDHS